MRVLFLLTLVVTLSNAANAQDGSFAPDDFESVMTWLGDMIDAKALLSQCPAEMATSNNVGFESFSETCAQEPIGCIELCNRGNANACFGVGLLLQKDDDRSRGYDEALFAKACALGMPLGCTNRAAGMLSAVDDDGRSAFGDVEATYDCTFRTFEMTCAADDAWGCMMLSMSLATGRGSPVDRQSAKAKLDRTCELLPGDGPCESAIAVRRWIDRQPKAQ
jgi:hypothetical protein